MDYEKYHTFEQLRYQLLTYKGRCTNLGRACTIFDMVNLVDITEAGYLNFLVRLVHYA